MLTFDGTAGMAPGATFECGEGWRGLISQAAAEVLSRHRVNRTFPYSVSELL